MRLLAISDLHVRHAVNRRALEALRDHRDDWLVVAGDVAESVDEVGGALALLAGRFAKVFWVPGNHELWSMPGDVVQGDARYRQLVEVCRSLGVVTPEDAYVEWRCESGRYVIAPLFLLYDYSFRPDHVTAGAVLRWAFAAGTLSADEALLSPAPYPTRAAWCAARCAWTERRLEQIPPSSRSILINHFPLIEATASLPLLPRFTPWCGTRRTAEWHRRFRAEVVVYGHLHRRATQWRDGTRFEEVSLGYPSQWDPGRGIERYLRQVLPRPVVDRPA